MLAEQYHYTPEQIADMSPVLQALLLGSQIGRYQKFKTVEDYARWTAKRSSF